VAVLAAGEAVVVVNRDLHLGNVLAAEREPWLVIDPKPLVGEPAFDAGHLVGDAVADDPSPRRVARLVALVADGLEADEGRVRDWALVRALEMALDPGAVGEPADGRRRLAEVLAGQAG
jgi:streptomycin 6-kinase